MPFVLEALVSTLDANGGPHLAPMGPQVPAADFDRFTLRPFPTSQTYRNLLAHGEGVLHVTDDVLLLAKAAIGRVEPRLRTSRRSMSAVGCWPTAVGFSNSGSRRLMSRKNACELKRLSSTRLGGGISSDSTEPSMRFWKRPCWRRELPFCHTRKSRPNTGGWRSS